MSTHGGARPRLAEPHADLWEQLSDLRSLLILSMLMTDSGDEQRILHLATTAVPSFGRCRVEGVYLSEGGWCPPSSSASADLDRAALETQLTDLGRDGKPVVIDGCAWAWALPLRGFSGEVGQAVVTADDEPSEHVRFLLHALAQQTGVALANARLRSKERATAEDLRQTNAGLELLAQATAALSVAATPSQVAEAMAVQFGRLLDTTAVAVYELRDHGVLDALTMGGFDEAVRRDWSSLPIDAPAPGAAAARRREPVWLEDRAAWQRDYPHLHYDYPSLGCVPLVVAGQCLGMVAIGFPTKRVLSPTEWATAVALAYQCAQALQRAGLLEAENEARRAAEDLSKIVGALSGATTPAEVGEVILDYTAELGATDSVVMLRDDDQLRVLVSTTPSERGLHLDAAHPLAHAARTGQPVWLAVRSPVAWREASFSTDEATLPVQMALPLMVGTRAVGVLGLHFGDDAPAFAADQRAAILTVAGQCAQALDRARLYQAEHEMADVLQGHLLPRRLPELARLAVAASYLPASHSAQAGGDWFEVLPTTDSRVAIAVGDVVGHGARAAAVMGQLRSALASSLLEGYAPAAALERLDRFARRVDGAVGSTCCCITLDWDTGELCYARAGHPPILLLGPDGPRFLDDVRGAVLGVRGRPPFAEARIRIMPGTTVLLYTDGLVERRNERLGDGLRRLAEATARLADREPGAWVTTLVEHMLDGPTVLDDVAAVAVRLMPPPLHGRLAVTVSAARTACRAAAEWARLAGLPSELADDLQLTLGEAVANAAEHAYPTDSGNIEYRVARTPEGGVEVRVREQVDLTTSDGTFIEFHLRAPGGTAIHRPSGPPDTEPEPHAPSEPVAPTRIWRFVGDLNLDTVANARATLLDLLDGPGDVVIDLREAGYLGSAAIGLVAEAIGAAHDRDTRLAVRVARGSFAERAISVTDLAGSLDIEWVD